jgi:cell division septum initiation protein DivIVA
LNDPDILAAALVGYQCQLSNIEERIKEIKVQLQGKNRSKPSKGKEARAMAIRNHWILAKKLAKKKNISPGAASSMIADASHRLKAAVHVVQYHPSSKGAQERLHAAATEAKELGIKFMEEK